MAYNNKEPIPLVLGWKIRKTRLLALYESIRGFLADQPTGFGQSFSGGYKYFCCDRFMSGYVGINSDQYTCMWVGHISRCEVNKGEKPHEKNELGEEAA